MSKKILIALTGVPKYPNADRATGIWLGEAVHFVKEVKEAGFDVDYVTPQGGYVPIDPHSLAMAEQVDWDWYQDKDFRDQLGTTVSAADVVAEDYAAIYFVGGHGVLWDFPEDENLQSLTRKIYEDGGVVSSVCHGVVGLLNVTLSDGSLLIAGRELTGFSNHEEQLVELDKLVPFLAEDELVKRGARFVKADEPWAAFAVADDRLVTGQNPASGGQVAKLVIERLKR